MADMQRYAKLSDDGMYRYRLARIWDHKLPCSTLFIMLNPSTADAEIDDPTIRRCIGFTRGWGDGGFEVVNLFAFRATKPVQLKSAVDPVGYENRHHVEEAVGQNRTIICAWGAHKITLMRDKEGVGLHKRMVEMIRRKGKVPLCLGRTAEGYPRHPLYVPASQKLESYAP